MKGTQLFALLIIGLMAFSTIAVVLSASFGNNANTAPMPQTPPTNDTSPATRVTYLAQTDANVLEVFPSFKLMALTKDFDISKIDSAIAQVGGITRVSSIFRQVQSQDGAQTYYIADVSFDSKKTSFEAVSDSITEKTAVFLGTIGFFPNALIVVPKKLLLKNADLNLSKDYELSDNVIQSYINSGTVKGDEILARVEIIFSGAQPMSTLSSEISNYSSEQKQHTAALSLQLVSLEPVLSFTADVNYSNRLDENSLKGELLKISDVNSVEVLVEPVYYKMLLTVNKPFSDSFEKDLNNSLQLAGGVQDFEFYPDENILNVIIGFPEESDLQPLKENISSQLSGLGISNGAFSFTEPTVSYSGNIGLRTTDAKNAAESVKSLFVSKKFDSKVYQLGSLEVNALTDDETKETFVVDSNSIQAAIFPVHKAGDEIFASIVFYSQRATLLAAQAIEIINPIRIG